jgi:hypothetical protein
MESANKKVISGQKFAHNGQSGTAQFSLNLKV